MNSQKRYWLRCPKAAELLDLDLAVVRRSWYYIEPVVDLLTDSKLRQEIRESVLRRDVLKRDTFKPRQGPLPLSERELTVLNLLSQGKRIKAIARILGLSPKTISTYRTRLLEKLELHTNADLVRYVLNRARGDLAHTCSNCGATMELPVIK